MLILYTKDGCPFCEKVKHVFLEKSISYQERNIKDPAFLAEAKGHGAKTLPFLVDTSANTTTEDSDAIIDYALEGSF